MRLQNCRSGTRAPSAQLCLILSDPWTAALQAPLSMEFSGENTGVGSHFLLQGIFLNQGWTPHLLHLLS